MEPARKPSSDIESDIRPKLGVIQGGGETTPDRPGRDSMRALSDTERAGTAPSGDGTNTEDGIDPKQREAEAATGAPQKKPWEDRTTPQDTTKKKGLKGLFKKASPALGVGGIMGIGGFVLIGLTSPSLLIVQMKEVMVGKFNTQLASMETRSTKLLASKMNGATSGHCGSVLTIRCKFTTMSKAQVDRMAAAGITVEGDDVFTGRKKPTALIYKNETIYPAEFSRRAASDADFRGALKQAYNAKYAGFVGKAWANVSGKHRMSKRAPELEASKDRAAAQEKLNQIAREGMDSDNGRVRVVPSDADCEGSSCVTQEEADRLNQQAEAIEESKRTGTAGADVRAKLSGINTAGVTAAFKVTGPIDYACQGYGAITMLSYMAKTIRMSQLIRYAMVYFAVADAIKAGASPDPADVAFLGDNATAVIKDASDPTKTLVASGTDSFGYKYAQYGDTSASPQSMSVANRFMAGGGFVGEMSVVTAAVLTPLGGRQSAKTTCGVLANPFVQGASIVLGIASLFVPGANVAKIAATAGAGIAVSVAIMTIPALLADIVAGTTTDDIVGEESVNAIASASGGLMSNDLAAQNGNGPMSKDDTLAYLNLQNQTNDQYIADELRETSPFDATNPHTFLGSISAKLFPIRSSSNPLTTLGSLLNTSISGIVPTSNALTAAQQAAALEVCQDLDIIEAGYAADPFCNVIRGIPPQYLNRDPGEVAQSLIDAGDLTETGTPIGNYRGFIEKCILNEEPLGYRSADTGYDNAEAQSCIITSANVNYYLNFADQRVELGMNDEDTADAEQLSNTSIEQPPNTDTYGQGWVLKKGEDYSAYQCDPRMTDLGVITVNGFGFTYRICGEPGSSRKTGCSTPVGINAMISTNYMNMREAAAAEGVGIGLSDGYRRNNGCESSQDGNSRHFHGTAMDLYSTVDGATICWTSGPNTATANACREKTNHQGEMVRWLDANAAKYGFLNLKSEAWHWSTGEH